MHPCYGDHPQGFPQAATLGKLDVDTVHLAHERRNVGRGNATFVGNDWDLRLSSDCSQALEVLRRERLLEHSHAELLENRQHSNSPLHRPAAVGVHPDFLVGCIANGTEDLEVTIGTKLYLEYRILLCLENLGSDPIWRIQSHGKRRFWSLTRIQTPH